MKKEKIIEFKEVTFTYKNQEKPSIKQINLEIYKGEFILLTGGSGCGKTTLNRCINGLIPEFYDGQLEGSIDVDGMDISQVPLYDISKKVGSVFQDPRSQFFTMHGCTEIAFSGENHGCEQQALKEKVIEAVEAFAIQDLMDKSILELSSGEKQKIAIASVYALNPNIIVLDEPSANLDGKATKQLAEMLAQFKAAGKTIIISEHKLYYLQALVDRVILMADGKIQADMDGDCFRKKESTWFQQQGLRQIDLKNIAVTHALTAPTTTRPNPQIKVQDINFSYSLKKHLWQPISFEAQAGDVIGVIGKNGVGKSTFIRVMMGLNRRHKGRIYDRNQRSLRHRKRLENSFYVMQDVDYQLFASSVLEEMLIGHPKTPDTLAKAEHYLKKFELAAFQNHHPSTLSGGQKQRLSVAMACMAQKSLVFLDEPTSGLDAENMHKVSQAIGALAQEGATLFVITHDYEFAAATFTKLLVMETDGRAALLEIENQAKDFIYQKMFYA